MGTIEESEGQKIVREMLTVFVLYSHRSLDSHDGRMTKIVCGSRVRLMAEFSR